MATGLEELKSFTQFAQEKLTKVGCDLTLEECIKLWRQTCEQQAKVDDIRQGLIDYEQGLGKPVDEVFDGIRRQLGISQS